MPLRGLLQHLGIISTFILLACFDASAALCALRVDVRTKNLEVPRTVYVRLLNDKKEVVYSGSAESGTAIICDFPFGTHQLVVGSPADCHPVRVDNIHARPGQTEQLLVVLNQCGGEVSRSGCELYLRIRSQSGSPITDAVVSYRSSVRAGSGDAYGRVLIPLLRGRKTDFIVSAPGFQPATLSFECKTVENIEHEVTLVRP